MKNHGSHTTLFIGNDTDGPVSHSGKRCHFFLATRRTAAFFGQRILLLKITHLLLVVAPINQTRVVHEGAMVEMSLNSLLAAEVWLTGFSANL